MALAELSVRLVTATPLWRTVSLSRNCCRPKGEHRLSSSVETPTQNTNMDSLLRENRVFPPPAEFAANAHIGSLAEYESMYRRSIEDPAAFWAQAA